MGMIRKCPSCGHVGSIKEWDEKYDDDKKTYQCAGCTDVIDKNILEHQRNSY